MPKIIRNAVKCKLCGETIESFDRHDFKWCKCKNVAVDGGHDYLKRCFKTNTPAGWVELSMSSTKDDCPYATGCIGVDSPVYCNGGKQDMKGCKLAAAAKKNSRKKHK